MCFVRPDRELPTACKLQTLGLIAAFGFDDLGDPPVPVGTRRHVAVIVAAPLQLRPANVNGYIKGPMHKPIPASYWVVDGMLLAGEYAGASTPARARPKLEALLDAGIRAFFDLTEEGELPPYQDLLRDLADDRCLSVAYDRVPIRDAGVPDPADLHRLLSLLKTNVDRGIPSYVHCWGGIGRTGTVIGCWLVEHSALDGKAALQRIAELRYGTPDRSWRSPERDEQVALVLGWAEMRLSLGTVERAGG
jgi:atypical dual specificity phosphatase